VCPPSFIFTPFSRCFIFPLIGHTQYEAWKKPEKANEWREKLPQVEAVVE
jgi:hypothetical protein